MAQLKTARTITGVASTHRVNAQDKIVQALTQAANQAKKQLASQGMKLPTQSWTGSVIRNPAI